MNANTSTNFGSNRGASNTMGQSQNNPGQSQSSSSTNTKDSAKDSVSDAIGRGTAGIAQSAQAAGDSLAGDVSRLRDDLASMQQTMSKFMSDAGGEAAKSARNVGQVVASQVSAATNDFVQAGTDMASQATDQMKTFASELEKTARKNPLGTLAATLVVGVVIGMMSRGRA